MKNLQKTFRRTAIIITFLQQKAKKLYTDTEFKDGDFIVFGPETRGLDDEILNKYKDNLVTIPMRDETRSLNLSNSIAIGAYEAIRQLKHLGE